MLVDEGQVAERATRSGRSQQRWMLVGLALVALLAGGVEIFMMRMHMGGAAPADHAMMARMHTGAAPADLDRATTRSSNGGLYRVRYETAVVAIPVNQIHSWTIHIETADGRPVEGATITVDGDMPQHLHGLPTAPQVTFRGGKNG